MATESEKKKILEELDKLTSSSEEVGTDGRRSLMATMFPVNHAIWSEAYRMACNSNTRVAELALTVSQDPVLVIELLRISNAVFFASSSSVLNVQSAIVRLGSEMTRKTLEKLNERRSYSDPEVLKWFEYHRNLCKKTSIASRIVAEAINRGLADDCQTAGLFMHIGDMLAVASLRETYATLANENNHARVQYVLATNHKFDTEKMGVQYLRKLGIPDELVAAVDRAAPVRSQERAMMRPIVFAADELVMAYEAEKLDRLAPGKNLPAKSHLRLLQLPEGYYKRIYERISEFLFALKLAESGEPAPVPEPPAPEQETSAPAEEKAAETNQTKIVTKPELEKEAQTPAPATVTTAVQSEASKVETSSQTDRDYSNIDPANKFNLSGSENNSSARVAANKVKMIAPPTLRTKKGNEMVGQINEEISKLDNAEDMIGAILEMLVQRGPFEKSALIVTSSDRKQAIVVAARGPNIGNGQTLELKDPLSPLAQCFSKVKSFSNRSSQESPFGSKAFALAPVDACHDSPVALYADCGNERSISFEARRVFRVAIELLNQRLPTVPGGIPVEL